MSNLLEEAKDVSILIRKLLEEIPRSKGVGDVKAQLRRSSVSIPSNLAEGIGRESPDSRKDRDRFFRTALGSLREAIAQLEILEGLVLGCGDIEEVLSKCYELNSKLSSELGDPYIIPTVKFNIPEWDSEFKNLTADINGRGEKIHISAVNGWVAKREGDEEGFYAEVIVPSDMRMEREVLPDGRIKIRMFQPWKVIGLSATFGHFLEHWKKWIRNLKKEEVMF